MPTCFYVPPCSPGQLENPIAKISSDASASEVFPAHHESELRSKNDAGSRELPEKSQRPEQWVYRIVWSRVSTRASGSERASCEEGQRRYYTSRPRYNTLRPSPQSDTPPSLVVGPRRTHSPRSSIGVPPIFQLRAPPRPAGRPSSAPTSAPNRGATTGHQRSSS